MSKILYAVKRYGRVQVSPTQSKENKLTVPSTGMKIDIICEECEITMISMCIFVALCCVSRWSSFRKCDDITDQSLGSRF